MENISVNMWSFMVFCLVNKMESCIAYFLSTRARINIKVVGGSRLGSFLLFSCSITCFLISELRSKLQKTSKKDCPMFGIYVIKQ